MGDRRDGSSLPITAVPTSGTGTAGTTGTVLVTDVTGKTGYNTRRLRLVNKSSTAYLGLLIATAGATLSSLAIGDSIQIPPGGILEIDVRRTLRLGVVADTSSTSYSYTITDI